MQHGRRRPPNAHDGGDELRAGRGEVPVHRRHRPWSDRHRLPAASLLGGRRAREREHVRGGARGGSRSIALRAGGRPGLPAPRLLDDESPAGCRQVVVSAGIEQDASPGIETTPLARKIAAALRADASDVYAKEVLLYGQDVAPPRRPDGRVDCSTEDDPSGGLGATTNVQGQFAAGLTPPRDFVSVESSERVRNSAAERDALSQTVGAAFSAP